MCPPRQHGTTNNFIKTENKVKCFCRKFAGSHFGGGGGSELATQIAVTVIRIFPQFKKLFLDLKVVNNSYK